MINYMLQSRKQSFNIFVEFVNASKARFTRVKAIETAKRP